MRLYGLALFVHILGVIAMFAGFAMQQRAGSRLRGAATHAEARPWTELLEMTRLMPLSGAIMVLVTGGYLSSRFGSRQVPVWMGVAVLAAVVIGATALFVVNRDIRAIIASVNAGEGPLSVEAAAHLARPRTWGALGAANGAALGAVWLMTMKPGPIEAWLALILPTGIGMIAGTRLGKRPASPASAGPAG
jgi:hypothetical protein